MTEHDCPRMRAAAALFARREGVAPQVSASIADHFASVRSDDTWCPFCGAVLRPVRHALRHRAGELVLLASIGTSWVADQLLGATISCVAASLLLPIVWWTTRRARREEATRRQLEEAAMHDRGTS